MIQPISKYLVVKAINEEVRSGSGMILSGKDINDIRYVKGKLVACGDEVDNLKADDIILYDKSGSFTMVIEGETLTICQYRDVVLKY